MFKESNVRTLLKMLSWRLSGTLATMLLVYAFVRRVSIVVAVGAFELVGKMTLYYVHERAWNKIKVGRHQITPFVLWFTGLPSSGKSTLADETYDFLLRKGYKAERLDGDTVRSVFPKTGFSKEERDTHIRRVGFLASMLEKHGVIVVSSFVSPYKESREFVRSLCDNFIEIHVATSIEECERRDIKDLYKKARAGEIKNFTGISDPYEIPEHPQIVIDTEKQSIEESFQQIKKCISRYI